MTNRGKFELFSNHLLSIVILKWIIDVYITVLFLGTLRNIHYINSLKKIFPGRFVLSEVEIVWSARSPDSIPCNSCVCMWGYLKVDVALRSWRRHNARESSANTSNITISQTQTCYCRWKIIQRVTSPNKTKVLTFLPQWPVQTVSPFIRPTLSPKYSTPQNRVRLSQFSANNVSTL